MTRLSRLIEIEKSVSAKADGIRYINEQLKGNPENKVELETHRTRLIGEMDTLDNEWENLVRQAAVELKIPVSF